MGAAATLGGSARRCDPVRFGTGITDIILPSREPRVPRGVQMPSLRREAPLVRILSYGRDQDCEQVGENPQRTEPPSANVGA